MADCVKHKYGEPDQQGYVTCWVCGDTFNLAEAADEDDDYVLDGDFVDDDPDDFGDDAPNNNDEGAGCLTCGGSQHAHKSGCPEDDAIWY